MIISILFVLWLALIIAVVYIAGKKFFVKETTYSFKDYNKTDIPYITMDVQGVSLNMLVDTCCAVSIINKNALDKVKYEVSERKVSLVALTPASVPTDIVNVPVAINGKSFVADFAVYDDDDLCSFKKKYGVTLHGILGKEFLEALQCRIDFKKHTITIP